MADSFSKFHKFEKKQRFETDFSLSKYNIIDNFKYNYMTIPN